MDARSPSDFEGRPCSKCGGPRHWTGSRWRCSPCYNAWQAQYKATAPAEQLARWNDTRSNTRHQWAPERRLEIALKSAAWRESNRERHRRASRDWYAANVERAREAKTVEYRRDPRPFLARNLLRKARLVDAVCEHGPKCVSMAFLRDLYAEPCLYCNGVTTDADHFQPLARGGLHCRDNIVPACGPCNRSKKDRDPMLWMATRKT